MMRVEARPYRSVSGNWTGVRFYCCVRFIWAVYR